MGVHSELFTPIRFVGSREQLLQFLSSIGAVPQQNLRSFPQQGSLGVGVAAERLIRTATIDPIQRRGNLQQFCSNFQKGFRNDCVSVSRFRHHVAQF